MNSSKVNLGLSLLLWVFTVPTLSSRAFAHKGVKHDDNPRVDSVAQAEDKFGKVNAKYKERAKSLLMKACADCHSRYMQKPWYADFPFVRDLIANDIAEAKKHLDISNDFPFEGHGMPREDLEAIIEVIQKDSMPPWEYSFMHPKNKLTESEKNIILQWAEESSLELK